MEEVWKKVVGYEDLYEVSNIGRVRSLRRNKILSTPNRIAGRGYPFLYLYRNGKRDSQMVHRLVAKAFIPNPNNYDEVNHKDEDATNNVVTNLEWCTHSYNMNYGTRNYRAGKANARPIDQYTLDGTFVRHFECGAHSTERITGIPRHTIRRSLKHLGTLINFYFRYTDETNP